MELLEFPSGQIQIAVNPEPAIPFFQDLFKVARPAFEAVGAVSVFHWMSEHPMVSLGVIFGVCWMILADKN